MLEALDQRRPRGLSHHAQKNRSRSRRRDAQKGRVMTAPRRLERRAPSYLPRATTDTSATSTCAPAAHPHQARDRGRLFFAGHLYDLASSGRIVLFKSGPSRRSLVLVEPLSLLKHMASMTRAVIKPKNPPDQGEVQMNTIDRQAAIGAAIVDKFLRDKQ